MMNAIGMVYGQGVDTSTDTQYPDIAATLDKVRAVMV